MKYYDYIRQLRIRYFLEECAELRANLIEADVFVSF